MKVRPGKILSTPFDMLARISQVQNHINYMFKKDGYMPVPTAGKYFQAGSFWEISPYLDSISEVLATYEFDDIESDEVVLDIGANIGAFTILASKAAKTVYAIEPIFGDIIERNLKLNGVCNVTIFRIGLGRGVHDISYGKAIKKRVPFHPLSEIIAMCGSSIDFLKMDCEGGEWYIEPGELQGIRRIEAEIHVDPKRTIDDYISSKLKNYDVFVEEGHSPKVALIHGWSKLGPARGADCIDPMI